MSILNNSLLLGAPASATGYTISRSLRFNAPDSAYLSRTPGSAGNRKTWTFAFWWKNTVKSTGLQRPFLVGQAASPAKEFYTKLNTGDDNTLSFNSRQSSDVFVVTTTQVFRDPSAWYHIVLAVDTTQATASNRVKIFVNGAQITAFSTATYPSQNLDIAYINESGASHFIGRFLDNTYEYLDSYLAEVFFIDGQALDPTSFGQFDATTGVWVPKAYTGTYGTNGFKLDFADNSSNTATTLGKDTSGNGNNWTPNNFAVSANPVYSLYTTASPGFNGSYPVTRMFDGTDATEAITSNGSGAGSITFTPATAIAYTSGVEVYNATGPSAITATLNGGSPVTLASNGWNTVASGSGSITSLVINRSNGSVAVGGIRINGTLLLTDGAGAGNDSLVDVPTNGSQTDTGAGGEVRGNYCTLNPLGGKSTVTLANGNLERTGGTNNKMGTIGMSSGKWYWEIVCTDLTGGAFNGITEYSHEPDLYSLNYMYSSTGAKFIGTSTSAYGASYAVNDVVGFAYDADNGSLVCYKNGVSQGTLVSGLSGKTLFPVTRSDIGAVMICNFGQRPFAYTAPSGFKALCTANLPAPTIVKPDTAFDVKLYTGNGSTQSITGLGFSPDLVWTKSRSNAYANAVFDIIRGATNRLETDSTSAAYTEANSLTAFNSDGFTLGGANGTNANSATYAAWAWDAGSTTVTNTAGSITSSVRANATAGFSIVTYTGNGVSGATIGHGLGVAPSFLIVKSRDTQTANSNWCIYHASLGRAAYLEFSTSAAFIPDLSVWNDTSPSSSVFTVGNYQVVNTSSKNYVAYCFAPVAGYSAFGSYTGNGSANGPFVYTGHRSRWIMLKSTSTTGDWVILDAARDSANAVANFLRPNLSNAEGNAGGLVDFCSNGFKLRNTFSNYNTNGTTYVWASFAESPFQYARAR